MAFSKSHVLPQFLRSVMPHNPSFSHLFEKSPFGDPSQPPSRAHSKNLSLIKGKGEFELQHLLLIASRYIHGIEDIAWNSYCCHSMRTTILSMANQFFACAGKKAKVIEPRRIIAKQSDKRTIKGNDSSLPPRLLKMPLSCPSRPRPFRGGFWLASA